MKRKLLYIFGILFVTNTLLSITEQTYTESEDVEVHFLPEADCIEPLQSVDGGPSQPEVQSFTPADVSNMVNLFTGDFSYNIPLLDVGGYPINIAYNQGVGMEEDASCVGLGWNLSVGSINRIVRGLPDDFSGDEIVYEQFQKSNTTLGVSVDVAGSEIFGFLGANLSAAYRFNNYTGINTDASLGLSAGYGSGGTNSISGELSGRLGLNSDNGPYSNANVSFSYGRTNSAGNKNSVGGNFGVSASTYEGFESFSFGLNYSKSQHDKRDTEPSKTHSYLKAGNSGSHSFNSITSLSPKRNCPMTNIGFSYKSHIGGEIQGVTLQLGVSGFYMEQRIASNKKITPAYGYLFSHKAAGEDVLFDFQRDEETSVDDKIPNLPATAFTYDLFQVNGQGLSGQFRAYRNDVGILHDPSIENGPESDANVDVGLELEVGTVVGFGADVGLALGSSESGKWTENNEIIKLAAFKDTTSTYPDYKPFYFKEVGESTLFDNDIFNATEGTKAVRFETGLGSLVSKLNWGINQYRSIDHDLINQNAAKCNTLFSYLNASDASSSALEQQITDYPLASAGNSFPEPIPIDRVSSFRNKHHLSEITVTKDDGIRYVYGIPAYNTNKKEVSFNISGGIIDTLSENLIEYANSYTDHKINGNGLNHAYSSTSTPGYAYAYLLTDIVSTDYVDKSGDGLTPDDNGTFTKFKYHKASTHYRWRIPYLKNAAHYQSNTNNLYEKIDGDDMASFTYGEKEVWYNQSVETKNYVALFYYSPRLDARGVINEDGGIDLHNPDQQLLKLDSISLFTRVSPGVPIQTVHFVYDYSLCKGTPTNSQNYDRSGNPITEISLTDIKKGKLTLKEIYFTYQKSGKGKLVKYKFTYQNNRNYEDGKNDRWGNFKEDMGDFDAMSNKDFPYAQQIRRTSIDSEAAAWCLSQILTPSNSAIDIQYESDDYAFVQDKPAMQMVKVLGFGNYVDFAFESGHAIPDNSMGTITRDDIYLNPTMGIPTGTFHPDRHPAHDVLYFKLPERQSSILEKERMLEQMTKEVKEIFFNMNTKIGGKHEGISGFMQHDDHGLVQFDGDIIAWIKIIVPPLGDNEFGRFHPVSLAAFRYALENLPRIAKGVTGSIPEDPAEVISELGVRINTMFEMLAYPSINDFMMANEIGNLVDTSQSYIRLNNPYQSKYGGGARVKRVTVSDHWNEMSGSPSKTYGVEYDYSMQENGLTISSGVASYEPEIGNDENPVYQPVRLGNYDDPKYRRIVTPVGRSLFPAATVGYSKVTVQSLQDSTIERTGTGKTEYEFYTARDFPVYVSSTSPQMISNMDAPEEQVANAIASFLYSEDRLTISQGHAIRLNDMHGKQKSISVYAQENSIPISGTSYVYKTQATNPKFLENHVDFISPDGIVSSGLASMECDFIIDTRYEKTWTWLPSANININTIYCVYPIPVFTLFPWLRYDGKQVHVVSTTKVIHQTGIIDSIIAFENGAKVTTKNIAYDSETGQPLVTQTSNEFNARYYSLKVPAHWVEPGMGHAGFNTGDEHKITTYSNENGFATIYRARDHFYKGDEVSIASTSRRIRLWVDSVEHNRIRLIDHNGSFYFPPSPHSLAGLYLKIIRSGKRNMQSISVGEISMQENPIKDGSIPGTRHLTRNWNKVVNASATKYTDHWQTYNIQRVTLPHESCSCEENKNGIMVIQQVLGWITSAEGPGNLNFSNLLIPAGIVSDPDKQRYFGSGPLVISSETYSNCAEISLNATCVLTLCALDGRTLSEQITSISLITPIPNTSDTGNPGCSDHYSFSAAISFSQPITHVTSDNRSGQIIGRSQCIPVEVCQSNPSVYSNSVCDMVTGIPVNPYVEGIRGQYRPLASYMYNLGLRTSPTSTTPLALSASGFYESFHPYWICEAFGGDAIAQPEQWKSLSIITKIDPNGRALETKDAIGVYSADLYGFNKNLVVASAQNAGYHQIAFESFEDAGYPVGIANGGCPQLKHWSVNLPSASVSPAGVIDKTVSHTGQNSLRLYPGGSQSINISLAQIENRSSGTYAYFLNASDLAGQFKPSPGEYYVSAWVNLKTDLYNDGVYDTYSNAKIKVNNIELNSRTNIIDGWQQVWGTIIIRESQNQLSFELIAGPTITYFDDIRIQPANSSMKTYVYRPDNLRLCAELDENNFATLYEYDDEGALTRTKKETELGLMTIQEIRFANPKTP